MFGKNKKTKISIDDYIKYRELLIKWKWMTEAYDSVQKRAIYKPTKFGIEVYSAIVRLVGTDNLVNNFKLLRPDVENAEIMSYEGMTNNDEKTAQELVQGNILTKTFDSTTGTEKYELTPVGAEVFIAFFVSGNRTVGTLPGDKVAKFFEIMGNMPKYSMKFSGIMKNIADGFAAFDKMGGGMSAPRPPSGQQINFGQMPRDTTPRNYAWKDTRNIDETGRRMMNNFNSRPKYKPKAAKTTRKTKQKGKSKSKKKYSRPNQPWKRSGPDTLHDFYSKSGKNMMGMF